MNRIQLHASVFSLALVLAAAPAFAQQKKADAKSASAEKNIAVVNGKGIPFSRADVLLNAQLSQGQTDSPELRNAVREELVRREILVQEAIRQGADKKPDVQAQMELARQGVVISAYLGNFARSHPVNDEQVQKEYDSIRATLGNKEYHARHILVDSEDDAKAIIEKIKKGDRFEDLAKQSKDPGSKERGGDLGWSSPASYVKPFADAMVKLEKGKYTEAPVKSDFGWHVIQLDDTRELKAPPLEEIKAQLSSRLQQQAVERHIMDLRNKAKVE